MLAVLAILWSIGFLADIDGPQNALIGLYNTFGLTDQAEALAHDGLDPVLSKAILGIVGLAVGIGGIWFIYIGVHSILEMLGRSGTAASPWLLWSRAPHRQRLPRIPAVTTIITSFTEGEGFIENYGFVFTDPDMLIALRNNALWLVLVTGGSVIIGLVIATRRPGQGRVAGQDVHLPAARHLHGRSGSSGVSSTPAATPSRRSAAQRGLDRFWQRPDAVAPDAGRQHLPDDPDHGLAPDRVRDGGPVAAIKGIPSEIIEAARCDGAGESRIFFRIIVPSIWGRSSWSRPPSPSRC